MSASVLGERESSGFENEPRAVRRRHQYRRRFLPEYISCVAVAWICNRAIVAGEDNPLPTVGNPHAIPAAVLFWSVALFLVGLTIWHRIRFSTITLDRGILTRRVFWGADYVFDLAHLKSVREGAGTFFWRKTRVLWMRFQPGGELTVNDFIAYYDDLRDNVVSHTADYSREPGLEPTLERTLQTRSRARDELYGDEVWWHSIPTMMFRAVCLLPIAFVEIFLGAYLVYVGFHGGHATERNPLAVYSSVIMLIASAITARTAYYYIFSSRHGPRYQKSSEWNG